MVVPKGEGGKCFVKVDLIWVLLIQLSKICGQRLPFIFGHLVGVGG